MLLSLLIFLPLFGSLITALLPNSQQKQFRWIALGITAANLLLSGLIYATFDQTRTDYQIGQQMDWITLSLGDLGSVSIDYLVGIDVMNLPLILLTAVVMLVEQIRGRRAGKTEGVREAMLDFTLIRRDSDAAPGA